MEGWPNRRNKAAFSNFSGIVRTLPYATCCGDKILSPQQNFFKTGMSHEEKCHYNMSPQLVCANL